MTKVTWRGKGYLACTSILLFIIKEVRTGIQAREELGGRGWCRSHGECASYWPLPYGLLRLLCYRTKAHQPKDGITQNQLARLSSLTNENTL